jgi:hypothetical protein
LLVRILIVHFHLIPKALFHLTSIALLLKEARTNSISWVNGKTALIQLAYNQYSDDLPLHTQGAAGPESEWTPDHKKAYNDSRPCFLTVMTLSWKMSCQRHAGDMVYYGPFAYPMAKPPVR